MTHAKRTPSATQIDCALMQGAHLVVDVRQEAPQLPVVAALPSPVGVLLLVGPLLGMLHAGQHIDLQVQHIHCKLVRPMMAVVTNI